MACWYRQGVCRCFVRGSHRSQGDIAPPKGGSSRGDWKGAHPTREAGWWLRRDWKHTGELANDEAAAEWFIEISSRSLQLL